MSVSRRDSILGAIGSVRTVGEPETGAVTGFLASRGDVLNGTITLWPTALPTLSPTADGAALNASPPIKRSRTLGRWRRDVG